MTSDTSDEVDAALTQAGFVLVKPGEDPMSLATLTAFCIGEVKYVDGAVADREWLVGQMGEDAFECALAEGLMVLQSDGTYVCGAKLEAMKEDW